MIQQARLKTELELAAKIQFQLLPQKSPTVAGLDIAARSRPALQVGGDFYDFIAPIGWPFSFAIGDVSGKGVSAALLMAMTRTVIRSKASSLPTPTPEVVLGYSNEIMYDDFTEVGMFATVFVGRYDPTTRSLFYANAGHSPVVYCPADGSSILLEADGPAMGVLPLSLSENHKIHFQPDDLLVITTDGFNEASNPAGEMFGMTRLLQLIDSVASKSASEISAAIFKAVQNFSASRPQDDDQTLVVIKGVPDE
jgi:sigma-B regulation protein RsbU (phosphoserine phosphatase)